MATFILVHGSWHGAWCWEKVVPQLESAGHKVFAPDLPGHGTDKTPLLEITLDSYVNCITRIMQDLKDRVILVGHSMSGVVINQVAEYFPAQIEKLIYVTGFVPRNGESMFSLAEQQGPSRFAKYMKMVREENAFYFDLAGIKEFAYHLCDDKLLESIKPKFCVEPLLPSDTPVKLTDGNFGRVPRVFVECEHDQAVWISTQRKMHQATPCKVHTLQCDHSPFYSDPDALINILLLETNIN